MYIESSLRRVVLPPSLPPSLSGVFHYKKKEQLSPKSLNFLNRTDSLCKSGYQLQHKKHVTRTLRHSVL